MGTYRTVKRLSPEAAAYVAGVVDGEGTVTLSAEHRGERRLDLLSQIATYLKTYRSKRAEMAIQQYVALTPRNGKYPEELLRRRGQFEREFLAVGPGLRSRRDNTP